MKTRMILVLATLPLLAGCSALGEFLASPEGQQAVEDGGDGLLGVILNPTNPAAWVKLGGFLLTLGAVAVGIKATPPTVRAAAVVGKKVVDVVKKLKVSKEPK